MSGGGGNEGNFYENQDKLFGTQADIAQSLYNQYANYAPGYLNNTWQMTNEANSGQLAARARGQAGADASQAFSNSMAAARRDTARYGTEFNADRMATRQQDAALTASANKAGAMNSAGQWAEDQKWNRNANAYGQISGMSNGAMQGLGSAGTGYGGMSQQQQSSNAANAAGYGKFGSAIGTAMYKADGGYVEKRGLKFASGGPVPMAKVDWRSQPTRMARRKGNGLMAGVGQVAMGIAPHLISKHGGDWMKTAKGWFSETTPYQDPGVNEKGYYSTGPSNPDYAEAPNYADASMQTYNDAGYYSTGPSNPDYAEAPNYADTTPYQDPGYDADGYYATGASDADTAYADGGYVGGLRFAAGGPVPGAASSNPARAQSYRSSGRQGMTPMKGVRGIQAARSMSNRFGNAGQTTSVESSPVSADMTSAYDQYGTLGTSGAEAGSVAAGSEAASGAEAGSGAASGAEASSTAAETTTAADAGTAGASASEGTGAASSSAGSAAGYGAAALSLYNNAQQARYKRNDRDGFGKYSPDYRHAVGSAILSYYLKGAGDMVADEIEPVMEPLTRGMIMTGDRIGGAGGALLTDPIGATVSGKYSGEELVKGAILGPVGKYLADGGPAGRGLQLRRDFTPGGYVEGPGTTTSDDIPAWLSDEEYVLNAEATEIIGKDKLDKINQRGLKLRKQREEKAAEGTPNVKDSPAEEKAEKRRGLKPRKRNAKRKGA